uniref:Putative GIY-YIG homing endonuclease n=1 Tax=Lobochlamys culleus TaxID=51693 RepID=A0A0S2IDA0_9CHLO|nr:putative GIY-YIG homing endonuclease [Lobochlamys culleus]
MQNLLPEKGRFETRLNGGRSSVSSLLFDNVDHNGCNILYCDNSNPSTSKSGLPQGIPEKTDSLTYNKMAPTNNPVPERISPKQLPGVYMILCVENNKRYYGESTNVSSRLSQHKSRLRRNIHEISELQRDWNLYGEDFFEFSVLFISRDCDKAQREALELEYITRHSDLCYNKFFKHSRKKENNPFWGRKHNEETRKQIGKSQAENRKNSIPEGLAIILKGEIYPSIAEASRQTNHSRDTIRRWLNDPNNMTCLPFGIQLDTSKPSESDVLQKEQLNTGFPKRVSLDGTIYSSIAEAARRLNCSRANIQRRLRTDKENCFFV